jgi:uncharacterized membrane protein YraQ (UPF0718 family)
MKKTTLANTILILAIILMVVAGVVLYIKNQQLIDHIDTLIEQGNYNEEDYNN